MKRFADLLEKKDIRSDVAAVNSTNVALDAFNKELNSLTKSLPNKVSRQTIDQDRKNLKIAAGKLKAMANHLVDARDMLG